MPNQLLYVHKLPRDVASVWRHFDEILAATGYTPAPRTCGSCSMPDGLGRPPLFSPDNPAAASYVGWRLLFINQHELTRKHLLTYKV